MRYSTLWLFNFLLLSCSGIPESGKRDLEDFFGSMDFSGRHIVVIDMDKCASCHYKQILDLCQMDCPDILLLIHSTIQSKTRILSRDCKNGPAGRPNLSFFSDNKIMQAISQQDASSSLFLVSKSLNDDIAIRKIIHINEVIPYCH